MKKSVMLGLLVIFMLIIFVSLVSAESNETKTNETEAEEIVCATTDVQECWDGSYVNRNPDNNCEFDSCPEKICPTVIGWRIENGRCVADTGCDYDPSRYAYYDTEEICVIQLKEESIPPRPEPEPVPVICSELLIKGDIGNYNYYETKYESGPPIYSEDGKQIGTAKCCGAYYKSSEAMANIIAYVCPYDNRKNTENSVRWLAKKEGWGSKEYIGQNVYWVSEGVIWINGNYLLATINKGRGVMPEAIAEVYLKKYHSDLEVPTVEAEEEKPIPKPVPCGIGTCVPEEEPEEPEEIPEDKVFYKCNGCELGDKCYPMGYRKQGQYCSDNNEFIGQLGSGTCDNNFECKSNVCISSECVGEGLIKKILNWFKKLFGGEDEEPEPEPGDEICRELLIEENIGDYEYFTSEYGSKDAQIALYSEDGEQIDIVKCCVAGYSEPDGEPKGTAGLVCPFNNRRDMENSIYWLLNKGEITLEEYKGQEVYSAGNAIIWTHKDFIVAAGTDPKATIPLPEKIINAYLDKYKNDLEETQNADECEEITDSDEKYKCYTSLAIKDKDISICERIIIRDEVYRQTDIYIKDKCYRDVAIETGNANACEKISGDDVDTEDSCYIEIALKTKDSSLCEKTIQKNLCYAIVTNNPNICERITTSKEKDACYYLVAIETNDNSLCGRINSTFGKDECYENIA